VRRDSESLETITISGGVGSLYFATASQRLTIVASEDGSGAYTLELGEFKWRRGEYAAVEIVRTTTVQRDAAGTWSFTDDAEDLDIDLLVNPDGTGEYIDRSSRSIVAVDFDSDGTGPAGSIEMQPVPVFTVASSFPPVGTLGSLAPRCEVPPPSVETEEPAPETVTRVIVIDALVLFDFGEHELLDSAGLTLEGIADALIELDDPILIRGHTDSVGTDEDNLELSLRRAEAVKEQLVANGLTVEIDVEGVGETEPREPNKIDGVDNEAGRAANRRVEIVVLDENASCEDGTCEVVIEEEVSE